MKTLLQMIKDRDYLVPQRDLQMTYEEFIAKEEIQPE